MRLKIIDEIIFQHMVSGPLAIIWGGGHNGPSMIFYP